MKKTLLVVDDEAGVRMLLEHYLGEDYEVVAKEDGQLALDWVTAGNKADLVLSDIEMPRLDGFELLKSIRNFAFFKTIPYVMVSGKNKQDNYVKSFKLGANDYISKPFSAYDIQEKVRKYLLPPIPNTPIV